MQGAGPGPARPVQGNGRVLAVTENLSDQTGQRGARADFDERPDPRRVHRLDLVLEEDR